MKEFIVLSPDKIPIENESYESEKLAIERAKNWVKRYELQGYYSSVNFGRIPLNKLLDHCKIIELKDLKNQKF